MVKIDISSLIAVTIFGRRNKMPEFVCYFCSGILGPLRTIGGYLSPLLIYRPL